MNETSTTTYIRAVFWIVATIIVGGYALMGCQPAIDGGGGAGGEVSDRFVCVSEPCQSFKDNVYKIEDREYGVVCYVADGFEAIGIDCFTYDELDLVVRR